MITTILMQGSLLYSTRTGPKSCGNCAVSNISV